MEDTPKLSELKRFLFVINPIAGERDKEEFRELIESYAEIYGWDYKIFLTTGKEDPEAVQGILQDFDPEVVFAVGGDGTVNMVAERLDGTHHVLGIVPAGSGNGLAKDLHIPHNNTEAAMDTLIHGQVQKIDTLRANDFFFMHLADIGFNAHVVKLFNRSKKRGLTTYMRFVVKEFFKYSTHSYEVETDNGHFSGEAFMVTVANSNQFGSNLTINPEGNWSDGKFEVIIIKPFPKKQALTVFWRLLTKKITFSPYCVVLKCTRAKVRCRKKRTLQYDGEITKKVKEVNFRIHHKNLQIIVP